MTFCALLLCAALLSACAQQDTPAVDEAIPSAEVASACDTAARSVVLEFGSRLRRVPLLAPDSVLDRELTAAYGGLVTPELLRSWQTSATEAPGRETSSPWPERVDIDTVAAGSEGSCVVHASIAYVTSVEEVSGGVAGRRPVRLRLVNRDGWRIDQVELGEPARQGAGNAPEPGGSPGTTDAARAASDPTKVIRSYYAAINAGDFREAYARWGDGGRSSGQSFEEFAGGFAATDSVAVEVNGAGRVEGAAGSRYVVIPVVVRSWLRNGTEQRYQGSYTLRRSVVDGASAAERDWHIYSADIEQIR